MIRRFALAGLLAASLAAPVAFAQPEDTSKVPRLTMAEFKKLHAARQVLPIDVRDPHSFDAGHIPGAVNVSFVDVEISANRLLKEKRTIVAYCACPNEHSSLGVAAKLMRVGVKDIRVLVGGWDGWKASGGKVEVTPQQ